MKKKISMKKKILRISILSIVLVSMSGIDYKVEASSPIRTIIKYREVSVLMNREVIEGGGLPLRIMRGRRLHLLKGTDMATGHSHPIEGDSRAAKGKIRSGYVIVIGGRRWKIGRGDQVLYGPLLPIVSPSTLLPGHYIGPAVDGGFFVPGAFGHYLQHGVGYYPSVVLADLGPKRVS